MPAKNSSFKIPPKSPPEILYPTGVLLQEPYHSFLKDNGYLKLSQSLKMQVTYNPEKCEDLWSEFSPNDSVFDLLEVRNAFYHAYNFEPHFISLFREKGTARNHLALLPLWKNSDKTEKVDDAQSSDAGKFVWFGSNWPEDNIFFTADTEYIPLLLTAAPENLELACIRPLKDYEFLHTFPGYGKEEDKKYFLDLTNISTLDGYLSKLKKKKRYNLKRDKKRITGLNPRIIYNHDSHLEDLFNLSINRFRELFPDDPDEHSAFEDPRRKNVFRNLLKYKGKYDVRTITTIINGKIEAVEFGLVYNKVYYALNAGADISNYSGLGVFSNLLVIEDAIKTGCHKVDFLEGDNNWKESWHLSHYFQYSFKK